MLDAVKLVAERMKLLIELSAGQTEDSFSLERTVDNCLLYLLPRA